MPTHRQAVINSLTRTGRVVLHSAADVPPDRWQDSPGGHANSLREVLQHLIECENWWLENIGVPQEERPPQPDFAALRSAEEMAQVFGAARRHLLGVVERLPDSFFEEPVPACRYGSLNTGADLLHYAAEHTNYHDGQIQMLEMAFA